MRNATITIIVLAFLALAVANVAPNGCDGAAPIPDNSAGSRRQPAVFNTGNPTNDRLLGLSPSLQATALAAVVGQVCVGSRAFYRGMLNTTRDAFWSVGCADGSSYGVEINADADGSTKVLNCVILKALNDNCFVRFSDQPDAQEAALATLIGPNPTRTATTRRTSPKATWIAMFFTSSCDRAQADVTYDVENSMQQEKDFAPTLVGGLYPLRSSDEIFTISAQDDPPTDDNGDPQNDCSDVKVSIWSFYGSRPSNPYYEWFAEHGKLLNSAESTERYGIADTTWTASQ